ncbi:ABC transporter substrate-binding protein [Desulfobacula phenolica]|uniref:Spermidine/putrescine transport system substrate-binding protein n=1 Tax=Desulfobacula phenolica TaxID=90732 RepID=A0A1H2FLE6_9BACT|nr:extracellular solute-binding protein [Desulfobacula phenolica]SDU08156.1 spermidine/putrescine transport system substrate-binding protein [Desulfobacula phenolica]
MKKIKRLILSFLMGFVLFFVPSCAQADNILNLLTWDGYAPDKYVAEFEAFIEQKYDKKVKINRTYLQDTTEIFVPVRTGKADIFVPTQHILNDGRWKFVDNNLALPLNLENIPNYKYVLKSFEPYTTFNGKVYAAPIAHGAYGLVYNTKYFPTPPKTWNILWDEQYKGKYTITKGTTEVNIYITALALGYDVDDMSDFAKLNNETFHAKLRTLVENAHSFWPGIDSPHHFKGLYLGTSWGWSLSGLNQKDDTWKMVDPQEGSPAWIDSHAIAHSLKNKPFLKKVAEEWINYTLGKKYQIEVVVNYLTSAPVTRNIVDGLPQEKIKEFHLDDPDYLAKYHHFYPTIKEKRDRNGLKVLWKNASKGVALTESKQE